ncbi:MAG TPA: serine/threonine-protein kinase [Burkholderiales bacterium]|nr:serine/threonine-protein kinase [Burkholderiales bacterium]
MSDLKTLGRYTIKGTLGQGAMGLVYDGLDPKLNRRVAIKTILTRKLSPDQAKMATVRFQREVRAVARLNHGNIVQVYDFGTEGDLAYIVMEFIEGKELKDYLDGAERFDLKRVYAIMTQLLDALHFAHQTKIIHRDVKPANIMITTAGQAKLADFGVARFTEPDGDQVEATRAGTIVGTPSYMAPEQIQGQPLDGRCDIFSAGIIFYQLLTWQKPFTGSQWELAKKIIEDDPVWPSRLMEIPADIDRVVARALAKDAERRYQTAGEFAEAIKTIAAGKPLKGHDDVFNRPGAGGGAAAKAGGGAPTEAEKEFWDGVKDSTDPDEISLYIEQFPQGAFVAQAQTKISELTKK